MSSCWSVLHILAAYSQARPSIPVCISRCPTGPWPSPTSLIRTDCAIQREYLQYLQSYARHFHLERHIAYDTEVHSASQGNDGRWTLETCNLKEQTTSTIESDALIVATGANQTPNDVPSGLAAFTGRILHSSQYDEDFEREVSNKNLRVLIVGGGESDSDITAELGDLSPNLSVWLRRPPCIAPRYLNDKSEMRQVEANKEEAFPGEQVPRSCHYE